MRFASAMISGFILLHLSANAAEFADSVRHISWDEKTRVKIAPLSADGRHADYARMVLLKNGELLCVYGQDGSVMSSKSRDTGRTWQPSVRIAAKTATANMVVPDILQLKDGSILVSYNPRPVNGHKEKPDAGVRFAIRTKKSYDNGQSWTDERLIYEAQEKFKDGCWEPAQIQLPDGEIQLFFSNEGIYTHSDEQDISLFRSADGGKAWTKKPQILSFRRNSRDGMPAPLILQNGEIVFSIEDLEEPGKKAFKPAIIRTMLKNAWRNTPVSGDSKDRNFALKTPLPDAVYAGAPYIRQLSTGETILSYQSTEGRGTNDMDKSARMMVAVGNSSARDFAGQSDPFRIPEGVSGLWNSLCVLPDDTIIALTSTRAYSPSGQMEVWMIKGRLQHTTNEK
ncbi:MAG: exo-alpha-sialidase [Mucilaginibacter polytrichastri]|nr:exo-alpha-sialidase [Mucilaginibacter polytrichastri]